MEQNESTVQGAAREAFEEASAECDDLRLFSVYNLPRISQVYIMFVGKLRNGYARASEETLEVGLFDHSEIPWSELAFPVVTESLTRFYDEIEAAAPRVHCADIHSLPGQKLEIVRYP
jgi:ADP-ribose pyrophosphatase YjhB (NUDIX family)